MQRVSTTLPKILYASIIKPKPLTWQKGEFEKTCQRWRDSVNADEHITLRTKIVAGALADFINRETGTAFPSYSTLAKKVARLHRPNAIKAIKELVSRGYLTKEPRQQTRGQGRQHKGSGEFHYIPNLMVSIRYHQLGLMVSKTGFNGINANEVPLQEQEVAGVTSEGPLNKKDRKQEFAPSARSPMARVVDLQIKDKEGIRQDALRAKEGSKEESPLPSSDVHSLPSCSSPPNPPTSAPPPFSPISARSPVYVGKSKSLADAIARVEWIIRDAQAAGGVQ